MNDGALAYLVVSYLSIFFIWLPMCLTNMATSDTQAQKRFWSRGALWAIVWPVAIVFFIVFGVVKGYIHLFKIAFGRELK